MPREDLLITDKEKTRARAEIHRFLTRLAVFAALCWVLFGVVFGLAVVPGGAAAVRITPTIPAARVRVPVFPAVHAPARVRAAAAPGAVPKTFIKLP